MPIQVFGLILIMLLLKIIIRLPEFDYGILVGPMIAEEIKLGQPTVGVAGLSCGKWETNNKVAFWPGRNTEGLNNPVKN